MLISHASSGFLTSYPPIAITLPKNQMCSLRNNILFYNWIVVPVSSICINNFRDCAIPFGFLKVLGRKALPTPKQVLHGTWYLAKN